jgi:hypothetical protein
MHYICIAHRIAIASSPPLLHTALSSQRTKHSVHSAASAFASLTLSSSASSPPPAHHGHGHSHSLSDIGKIAIADDIDVDVEDDEGEAEDEDEDAKPATTQNGNNHNHNGNHNGKALAGKPVKPGKKRGMIYQCESCSKVCICVCVSFIFFILSILYFLTTDGKSRLLMTRCHDLILNKNSDCAVRGRVTHVSLIFPHDFLSWVYITELSRPANIYHHYQKSFLSSFSFSTHIIFYAFIHLC